MNYKEANRLVNASTALVAEKFEEVYPDTFVKCKTIDPEMYRNANPCMYSWYMSVIRGINELNFSPQYSQTLEEAMEGDWSCVERFFDDLKEAEDALHFLIENVQLKY